jgi:hypothetical protein
MKRTGLLVLLTLLASTNTWAYTAIVTWADGSIDPTKVYIIARAISSDGYSMNHTYEATAKLKSFKREISQFARSTAGYVNASTKLPLQHDDLGEYLGSGIHRIDCPANWYDVYAVSAQNTQQIIRTGVSQACYKLEPGTCRLSGSDLVGTYVRIDKRSPYPPCDNICGTSTTTATVKMAAGASTCAATKPFFTTWTNVAGLYKCWPGTIKWGKGPCTDCREYNTACSQCI